MIKSHKVFSHFLLHRLPASPHQPPEVSRSPTVTAQELSLVVRSASTRRALISSSARLLSSALFVRLHRTSNLIFDSSQLLSLLFKKLLRHTLLVFSKIPTCALFTPSVSPSCPRIFSLPAESVGNGLKFQTNAWGSRFNFEM